MSAVIASRLVAMMTRRITWTAAWPIMLAKFDHRDMLPRKLWPAVAEAAAHRLPKLG